MSGSFGRPVENADSWAPTVWIVRMTSGPGQLVLTASLGGSDAIDSCQQLRYYGLLHNLNLVFIKTDPLRTSIPMAVEIEKCYQKRFWNFPFLVFILHNIYQFITITGIFISEISVVATFSSLPTVVRTREILLESEDSPL